MDEKQVKLKLKRFIVDRVLGRPDFPLNDDTSLIKSGILDSFASLEVVIFTEENFRVELSDEHLEEFDSVNDIAGFVIGSKKGN
jgi:acyl carrier protein